DLQGRGRHRGRHTRWAGPIRLGSDPKHSSLRRRVQTAEGIPRIGPSTGAGSFGVILQEAAMLSSAHRPIAPLPLPITTIGVGYNGSSRSARALALGRELAAVHGARIRVMEVVCPSHAIYDPHATGDLGGRVDTLLRHARERLAGLDGVDSCAVYGIAVDELAAFG